MYAFDTNFFSTTALAADVVLTTENNEQFYTKTLCPLVEAGNWCKLAEAAAISYITMQLNIGGWVANRVYHLFFTDDTMKKIEGQFIERYAEEG